jgi:hypothetical protein
MKSQYAILDLPAVLRRLLSAVLLIAALDLAAVARPQDQDLWTARPRPAGCTGIINVEALELDVSASMKLLLPELKNQVNRYIDSAPACTLMLIGTFGETADIKADEFLTDTASRERLKDAAQRLRAAQQHTNLDEVAKAIEWLQFRLQSAYGIDGYVLAVKVLSDQISAPSGDKPKFSLQKYLERHLAGGRLQVMEVEVAPTGTALIPAPIGGPGEVSVKVPIDQLLGVLAQKLSPTIASVAPTPEAKPPVSEPTAGKETSSQISVKSILVGCGLLAVLAAVGLFWLAVRGKPAASVDRDIPPAPQPEVPVALIVQEVELPEDGAVGSRETVLRERVRVPVLPNVAIKFGTDANSSNYVVTPGDGVSKDEIFRLTPARGLVLYLRASKGTACAGKPVPQEGLRLSARDPILITHGRRQWRITPSFTSRSQNAGEALFAPKEPEPERSTA